MNVLNILYCCDYQLNRFSSSLRISIFLQGIAHQGKYLQYTSPVLTTFSPIQCVDTVFHHFAQ